MFDPLQIKKDFPILNERYNGKELVYLDNAATAQLPRQVVDAMTQFYFKYNGPVARSSHFLAELANEKYDEARAKVAKFLGGKFNEIVFTKNATESLNLTAYGWGLHNLKKGDVVVTTSSEHNSSLLPWQSVAQVTGAQIDYLKIDEFGQLEPEWQKKLTESVKVVVLQHASNVLGNVLPLKEICSFAHSVGALVVVDGSQAIGHMPVNVQTLDCDFYAFSANKMLGPTGIGILWAKETVLEKTVPYLVGGGVVKSLNKNENSSAGNEVAYKEIPYRFEAGTPNAAGAVGLGAAIDYLENLGLSNVNKHGQDIVGYAMELLKEIEDIQVLGPYDPAKRVSLISFTLEGVHSHDISAVLSAAGIAVRSGLHCTMGLYKSLDLPASTRASFYVYNTREDALKLVEGVKKAAKILK